MPNGEKNLTITTARERLEETLMFFIDQVSAHEASQGLLYLLFDMEKGSISDEQQKALFATLQVINGISRLQTADSSAGMDMYHKLKIA